MTKLIAYQLALELVQLIAHTRIADAHLRQQARAGLDLFRLVTYDAGACSKANARAVRDRDLHYLFALKSSRVLAARRSRALARLAPVESADASRQTFQRGQRVVRRLYLGPATAAPEGWEHLRTVVRVQTETFDASDNLMTSKIATSSPTFLTVPTPS